MVLSFPIKWYLFHFSETSSGHLHLFGPSFLKISFLFTFSSSPLTVEPTDIIINISSPKSGKEQGDLCLSSFEKGRSLFFK